MGHILINAYPEIPLSGRSNLADNPFKAVVQYFYLFQKDPDSIFCSKEIPEHKRCLYTNCLCSTQSCIEFEKQICEGLYLLYNYALQMHCTENSKQIFPEMKLRGLFPNFYILLLLLFRWSRMINRAPHNNLYVFYKRIILYTCPLSTLRRKFEANIPRNETGRPLSQFLHSCVWERSIYSHDRSANEKQQNRQTDRQNI